MSDINSTAINEKKLAGKPEDSGYNSSTIDIIDGHLQGLIKKNRIQAAAYLISKNDKIFVQRSMGKLRYNNDMQFLPDSIRKIASITKVFTAVSILQLVEKGKIRLDQKVQDIIKEFKNPMFEKISIFHLLTHTSGIRPDPGSFLEPYPISWKWSDTKNWIRESLRDFLAIEPGKEWRYSSTGFTILGEIVSRVSGINIEKYIMDNIAIPLGMSDTFFDIPQEKFDRICITSKGEEEWYKRKRPEWAAPRSGGGLFSTMDDLVKFGQMLCNKGAYRGTRILSRKTVEAMTRNHTPGIKTFCWGADGAEMEYGLGMNVYSNNTFLSPGSFSHEGAGLCGLYMDSVENVVFVYFCPLVSGVDWEPEAVLNLRNIVWSGII
jgi:serine-type D-Ala-D-Ala carboxypeptidase